MTVREVDFSGALDTPLRHLLLSFPDVQGHRGGRDVIDALVEGGIHHLLLSRAVTSLLTVNDVIETIIATTGLRYESPEIIASLRRLGTSGHLEFRHAEYKAFIFSENRFRELSTDAGYREAQLASVQREWFDDLRMRHQLTDVDLQELWAGLDDFIARLVNRHAAEAAGFLYLEDAGGRDRFLGLLEGGFPRVDDFVNGELTPVARLEFPRFVTPTAARTDYLARRLRAAFFFHLLSIDPGASALIRENVSDKVFYLDSNFLYRLFGLHGPTLGYGPAMVVNICRQLNCRLIIAGETVEEFLRSLRNEVHRLEATPITHDDYSRLIAEHSGDEYAFMQAYFREYQSGRVRTVREFQRKYSNVDRLAKDMGIELEESTALLEAEETTDEFRDLHSALNTWTSNRKHPEVIAHDAFMLGHIRRLRGRSDRTPGGVKAWFLTYDRALTAYTVVHAADGCLPACLLADDWLQIARPFLPRTDDYEQSFVAMLRYPLMFEDEAAVTVDHMVSALHRLERFRDLPLPLVTAMVCDAEIVRRIEKSATEQNLKELVEVQAADYAKQLEKDRARLAHDQQQLAERVSQLEVVADEHRKQRDAARDGMSIVARERDRLRSELAEVDSAAKTAVERVKADANQSLEDERRRSERQLASAIEPLKLQLARLVAWGAYAVGVTTTWLLGGGLLAWRWEDLSTMSVVVFFCWMSIFSLALLWFPLRHRSGTVVTVLSIVGMVLGLGGLTYQLIEPKGSDSTTPSRDADTPKLPSVTPSRSGG